MNAKTRQIVRILNDATWDEEMRIDLHLDTEYGRCDVRDIMKATEPFYPYVECINIDGKIVVTFPSFMSDSEDVIQILLKDYEFVALTIE